MSVDTAPDPTATRLRAVQGEIARLRAELSALQSEQAELETLTGAAPWHYHEGDLRFPTDFVTDMGCAPSDLARRIDPAEVQTVIERGRTFVTGSQSEWLDQLIHYRQPDGRSRWFLSTLRAIERDADGALVEGLGGQVEVTESMNAVAAARRKLQAQAEALREANARLAAQTEQLKQANSALEEFAYAASHDLQAPLRAIAHFATWIDEDLPSNCGRQVRGHVKGLLGRVERMVRLHDDLLAYARIAGQTPAVEAVQLPRLLRSTWHHGEPPGGFVLALDVPDVEVQVTAVPLRTVLRNLFRNVVVHHDREQGVTRVTATVDDDGWLTIRIVDDGPGIPPAEARRIFDALYRYSDRGSGSGMGLAIARRHATQAGGVVRHAPTEGRGATFIVRWPLH